MESLLQVENETDIDYLVKASENFPTKTKKFFFNSSFKISVICWGFGDIDTKRSLKRLLSSNCAFNGIAHVTEIGLEKH